MIQKDLERYAQNNWSELMAAVTELSSSGQGKPSLVTSDKKFYNFDKIFGQLFAGQGSLPGSGDGLVFFRKSVCFVEFKSGFVQKITRNNYEKAKMTCDETGEECAAYRDLFFKNQETERKELLSNLRQKALEIYLTLEKKILPLCEDTEPRRLVFVVVIDDDPVNVEEDLLAELTGSQTVKDNRIADIRRSLRRLAYQRDAAGNTYCYDEIEVHSAANFSRMLNARIRGM